MNRQKYSRQRSPPRNTLQLQEQHYRLKELLRSDLSMLQQQNAILKLKCKKVSQLQQKVQLVLKQNQHLLTENEKMSRYLHQQKSQNELIRNKCQSMNNQKMNIVGDFQHQRKKMMRQMQLLGDRLVQEQNLKKQQINQMRSQFQLELQSIKRQMKASQDSYEAQIRKLREQLDKREYQLSQYANKLKRISNDADYEILRLKEEKEKLKNELIYCEEDRIKEVELLKSKFQNNFLEEIQAIKRSHLNNLQEMQIQNDRIKISLDDQHQETQGLITQLNKQKHYYQDTISYLKRDIQGYKHKLSQNQQLSSFQLTQLKQKLTYIHASQVQQIRNKQMIQLSSMQQQIVRCQKLINNKNIEIEQLIKDKMTNRNLFDSQMMRMKDQNNNLVFKLKDLQNKVNQMDIQLNNKINDRQKHIAYLQNLNKDLKNGYQNQSQAFQKIIQTLKQELQTQKMLFRQHQQAYKQQISTLKIQLSQLKTIFSSKESQLLRKIEQLKNELSLSSDQLLSKIQSLNNKNRMIQKQNQGLKNNLILKDKEIKNLLQRIKTGGERQKKLQGQIDDLRNKIIKRQQKSNDSMTDQKTRLQNSFNFQVQHMKADFEAALKLQANKYKDLQQRLRKKQFQLQQLLRMYKKMTDEIQVLTQQQSNKKDITLKYPGATADLIATKNLFDVYLKTKVLDICGSALRQSNKLAKN